MMDSDLTLLSSSDDSVARLLLPLLPSSPVAATPQTCSQTSSLHPSPEPYNTIERSPPARLLSSSPPAPEPVELPPSSPPPELPQSSSPSPSPRIKRRRERREQQNEVAVYGLRPRARKSVSFALKEDTDQANATSVLKSNTNDSQKPQASKTTGRLEPWQLNVLQEAFDAGVWCPGDVTVQVLAQSLKDRTDKQVRDWFSHRRRKLREAGMSDKGSEDTTFGVEALLFLSRSEPGPTHDQVMEY